MKKILITLSFAVISMAAYSQTYTRVIIGQDTLLKRVQTTTDTLKRVQIREQIKSLRAAKQANIQSIDILQGLNAIHDAEIVRLIALLRKTD